LENEGFATRCGNLDDPDEGLGEELLEDTDVLLWWGHIAHEEFSDALVNRIQQRVLKSPPRPWPRFLLWTWTRNLSDLLQHPRPSRHG
jgi:hypothetical protein